MHIKFIIGEAGTAKTSTLLRIQQNTNKKTVALAFTHSACNNMIEKGMKRVKTLHSFFRILPNTSYVNISYLPSILLIDEFSMIPLNLIFSIFSNVERYDKNKNKDTVIVLAGDLLQLPPIENEECVNLKNLIVPNDIVLSLSDGKEIINTLARTIYSSEYYTKSDKLILNKNFRSNESVIKTLNEIFESEEIKEIYDLKDLNNLSDYVFISSTYENLRNIRKAMNLIPDKGFNTRIGKINNVKNFILTENLNDKFFNGDIVEVVEIDDEFIKIKKIIDNKEETIKIVKNEYNVYNLLPLNFLTVHYAQGRGFQNVCICIDDLFELGMLYTAITRAKQNIKFITFKEKNEINEKIKKNCELFKILKKIIYQ